MRKQTEPMLNAGASSHLGMEAVMDFAHNAARQPRPGFSTSILPQIHFHIFSHSIG